MAQILCDCGCGEKVERPVFVDNSHRMQYVRHGAQKSAIVREHAQSVTKSVRQNAQEYEYADNGYGKKIRRLGMGDWEIMNPTTNKWVPYNE